MRGEDLSRVAVSEGLPERGRAVGKVTGATEAKPVSSRGRSAARRAAVAASRRAGGSMPTPESAPKVAAESHRRHLTGPVRVGARHLACGLEQNAVPTARTRCSTQRGHEAGRYRRAAPVRCVQARGVSERPGPPGGAASHALRPRTATGTREAPRRESVRRRAPTRRTRPRGLRGSLPVRLPGPGLRRPRRPVPRPTRPGATPAVSVFRTDQDGGQCGIARRRWLLVAAPYTADRTSGCRSSTASS